MTTARVVDVALDPRTGGARERVYTYAAYPGAAAPWGIRTVWIPLEMFKWWWKAEAAYGPLEVPEGSPPRWGWKLLPGESRRLGAKQATIDHPAPWRAFSPGKITLRSIRP